MAGKSIREMYMKWNNRGKFDWIIKPPRSGEFLRPVIEWKKPLNNGGFFPEHNEDEHRVYLNATIQNTGSVPSFNTCIDIYHGLLNEPFYKFIRVYSKRITLHPGQEYSEKIDLSDYIMLVYHIFQYHKKPVIIGICYDPLLDQYGLGNATKVNNQTVRLPHVAGFTYTYLAWARIYRARRFPTPDRDRSSSITYSFNFKYLNDIGDRDNGGRGDA